MSLPSYITSWKFFVAVIAAGLAGATLELYTACIGDLMLDGQVLLPLLFGHVRDTMYCQGIPHSEVVSYAREMFLNSFLSCGGFAAGVMLVCSSIRLAVERYKSTRLDAGGQLAKLRRMG